MRIDKHCKHIDGFYIEERCELNKFQDLVFTEKEDNILELNVKCNNMNCPYDKTIKIIISQV